MTFALSPLLLPVKSAQLPQPCIRRHRRPRWRSGERRPLPAIIGRPQPRHGRVPGRHVPQDRLLVDHAGRGWWEGERPHSRGGYGCHGTQPRYTRIDPSSSTASEQVFPNEQVFPLNQEKKRWAYTLHLKPFLCQCFKLGTRIAQKAASPRSSLHHMQTFGFD